MSEEVKTESIASVVGVEVDSPKDAQALRHVFSMRTRTAGAPRELFFLLGGTYRMANELRGGVFQVEPRPMVGMEITAVRYVPVEVIRLKGSEHFDRDARPYPEPAAGAGPEATE